MYFLNVCMHDLLVHTLLASQGFSNEEKLFVLMLNRTRMNFGQVLASFFFLCLLVENEGSLDLKGPSVYLEAVQTFSHE